MTENIIKQFKALQESQKNDSNGQIKVLEYKVSQMEQFLKAALEYAPSKIKKPK